MPSFQMRALLLGCAACALSTVAHAETAQPPAVDSVIVTGRPNPEDPPVVAQARERLSRTPGAVSVISAESYDNRQTANLADMLRDAPGVYAQTKWGGDLRLSIRGSGIGNNSHNRGTMLALDGLPLNEADGFGDFQLIDPMTTRFTEVYKGGNALRFGGSLLGGAVNIVTPTGRTAGYDNLIRIDGGAFGTLREHVAIARQWGDWDLYAAGTNATAQGDRAQSQQNQQFGTLNIGRTFGEDREVRVAIGGGNVRQEIPGALTLDQALNTPQIANTANLANDYGRNMRQLRGSLQTTWRLDEHTVLQGGVYAIWKDLDHPIFQVIDQESRNYGVFGRIDWQGELFGLRADAFAGAWARQGDLDARQFVNVKGAHGALTAQSRQNAKAVDVFGEGRLFVTDQLAVVGGATWGKAWRDYQSYALPGVSSSFNLTASRDYDWISPRVGLLWESTGGAQVFANLTRSVEPPNFSALSPAVGGFVQGLEPQKAWTAEVGARGRTGPLTWDVALYRAELRDELLSFAVDQDHPATTYNADRTIHQGVEAALDWRFAERWRLRQSLTLSDFRFDGDSQYGDNRLPVVPKTYYRAELKYEDPAGWFVAPSLEWSASDIWVDFANTARSPSYAVWSLNAGWAFDNGMKVFIDARNLGDERYVSNVNSATVATSATAAYWPGERRSLYAGFSAAF